ncbi:MAG: hypothetical protein COC19_00680 [SAR86 cluster bacterium]|uniref:Uncharacterized protein n=1 Tax=SAR86 cluster bacterium TaxID=2030880 RepID=A0A2A4MVE9_9GAMM|nr:MAG: hypothetical protein COC19_00680 [SAR86 cluster bacterium]
MSYALFHMYEPHRRQLIAGHLFYVEQAEKRLLSQFQNIEEEADKYASDWLKKAGHHFDPDRHDPGDFYEQAHDESVNFYQMLKEMENRTRLNVIAGMFHEWDKQLREWVVKEINHWHLGDNVRQKIWKVSFHDLISLFTHLGWNIEDTEYFHALNKCRLVVNVYKHGEGNAMEEIKVQHREYIDNFKREFSFLEHKDLKVLPSHITEFSEAIIAFWNDLPEYIWDREPLEVPDWFGKAFSKDREIRKKKRQSYK